MMNCGSSARFGETAQEKEAAGFGVPDEEDERVVGAENRVR
jgi:hypothetical protein